MRTIPFVFVQIALATAAFAQATIKYPPGAFVAPPTVGIKTNGAIDITKAPYLADKTGSADVTAIIRQAIRDLAGPNSAGRDPMKRKMIYFPAGTYRVSDTLRWETADGWQTARIAFVGESRDQTIIRLIDNCPGYSLPAKKPVIQTNSLRNIPQTPGYDSYDNFIWNLTIDVGSGNSGAIAIDYLGNNQANLRDLRIKTSSPTKAGEAGIYMNRDYPGPCLLKNIIIEGFSKGIDIGCAQYGVTMEDITLSGQTAVGVLNRGNVVTIRNLQSTSTKPAVRTQLGFTSITDSNLQSTSSPEPAIDFVSGGLFATNIQSSGYAKVVKSTDPGKPSVTAGPIVQYLSHEIEKVSDFEAQTSNNSLQLPVAQTPEFYEPDFAKWRNVCGPNPNDAKPDSGKDEAANIQAALNAAAAANQTTVYFPPGIYEISKSLVISEKIRKIEGLGAVIRPIEGSDFNDPANPQPMFIARGGTASTAPLIINNLMLRGIEAGSENTTKSSRGFLHESPRDLVLTNITLELISGTYFNTAQAGNLYLESIFGSGYNFNYGGKKVWGRHVNIEGLANRTDCEVYNNNCEVWLMGVKDERAGNKFLTENGGKLQLLGGFFYVLGQAALQSEAIFTTRDSSISASYITLTHSNTSLDYPQQAVEWRGVTMDYLAKGNHLTQGELDPYRSNIGTMVVFYNGVPLVTEVIVDNADTSAVTLSGVWPASTATSGYYATNYLTDAATGKGTKTVTFRPTIPSNGSYKIFLRWTGGTNRSAVVPVQINYAGGSTTLNVDQRTNGGTWVQLGNSYPFNVGTAGSVVIKNAGTGASTYVIADAVKLTKE